MGLLLALYLYSPYGPYGLYRASVPVQVYTLPFYIYDRTMIRHYFSHVFLEKVP